MKTRSAFMYLYTTVKRILTQVVEPESSHTISKSISCKAKYNQYRRHWIA